MATQSCLVFGFFGWGCFFFGGGEGWGGGLLVCFKAAALQLTATILHILHILSTITTLPFAFLNGNAKF